MLNVTVHTYGAFEKDKNAIPEVSAIMLSMIYKASVQDLFCPYELVNEKSKEYISYLGELDPSARFDELSYNILGNNDHKPNYHWIQIVKEQIQESLQNN